MFLYSFKLSKKRLLAAAVAVVIVVGVVTFSVRALSGGEQMTSANVSEKVKTQKVKAKTNDDRVAYAQSFGWEIDTEPAEVLEVIIPQEFDEVYQQYNTMQKVQGFDLEKYAGKRCKRYSYSVTNYPGFDDEVRFNILVYKDRVVGGDVCSTVQDGFMHGFAAQ